MSILYEGSKEYLSVDGKEEKFYCGESLNTTAITLVELREGTISLQQAYNVITKAHNKNVQEMVFAATKGIFDDMVERGVLREGDKDEE